MQQNSENFGKNFCKIHQYIKLFAPSKMYQKLFYNFKDRGGGGGGHMFFFYFIFINTEFFLVALII